MSLCIFSEPGCAHWEGFETQIANDGGGRLHHIFRYAIVWNPSPVVRKALLEKGKLGEMKSVIDFGLWRGMIQGNIDDLVDLAKSGVIGFKAFLSATGNEEFERADDFTLLR
ncbi:hypothetical protein JNUCC41_13995 [Brevibacillus sp. JNUCC-41]|nr:hypothetical protein [Brevibacillus sp. JNUCC-41]QOS87973.1 hypothetical protein JNUCC41_13995 [Brevibacillus sp. JNUCC-41]